MKEFTTTELHLRLPHISPNVVKEYVTSLSKGGYIEAIGREKLPGSGRKGRVTRYKLARDTGVDAPRLRSDGSELPPTDQQKMWLTMKIIHPFSVDELACSAGATLTAARHYTHSLFNAGYLARQGGFGNQGGTYSMIRNTGGLAPMVCRARVVFDPNLNEIIWHEEIEP
jgi:hypothetical protein